MIIIQKFLDSLRELSLAIAEQKVSKRGLKTNFFQNCITEIY